MAAATVKNIAYRPQQNRVTGLGKASAADEETMRAVLQRYAFSVERFLQTVLAPYAGHWQLDYASFRPMEESQRKLRTRARNDLLHVDSFPTRATNGKRILRVFTNVHPTQPRVWATGDPFEGLLGRFGQELPAYRPDDPATVDAWLPTLARRMAKRLGFKDGSRSAYDRWMLDFHNFLKEHAAFQAEARKDTWHFSPRSSWIAFTDSVSHSVLSGQYAVEQTLLVDPKGLVRPERAPLEQLRRFYGEKG